jgi:hypothetical protein
MINPVQFIMVGYHKPEGLPAALVTRIQELTANPAVGVIDVLDFFKDRDGQLHQKPIEGITLEHQQEPGAMILRLLTKAAAASAMNEDHWTGPAHLFQGDVLPDPREAISRESHVLAILLEHRWAAAMRDTAAEIGTYAIANGWLGRDVLKELDLMPQDAR